ncbi:MAG: 5'-nucleotidase C-terminal domain-containing protein [Spirochaetaceae bacterium]|jgi:5'-nucleotidase/UDP-sugar diphosphatase|nr:5'-nucleotidase C-terminal domain-containing protein [Spirochaetaceae bacterium]
MKPIRFIALACLVWSAVCLSVFARPMSEDEFTGRNRARRQEQAGLQPKAPPVPAPLEKSAPEQDALGNARPREEDPAGKVYELILLHTNDHHGAILPNRNRGGLAERSALVKTARKIFPQVLLVDAGDINTGPALSNMFNAEPDIAGYNLMGYEAGILGNHEFDGDLAKLLRQFDQIEFPIITSNIKGGDGEYLGLPYLIKPYDGFTAGIFGITTLRTKTVATPDPSLVFINELDAAKEVVELLRTQAGADIVIGITHMGDIKEAPDHITSLELAAAVPGIDIIVDGHSHSFFEAARKLGDTYIVSAHEWGKYLGAGRLSVANRKLVKFEWLPVPVGPDPVVAAALAPYIAKADESLKEAVGEAAEPFIVGDRLPRKEETALGNAICDGNVWYFKTVYKQDIDFAFHNGGNMRAPIDGGPITREEVLTALPFENYLYIVSLKGSDIIELFTFIASIPPGSGGFPQVSKEVRYKIDYSKGAGELKDLTIHGKAVDPARVYRFSTNDYLLGGGDGYTVLAKAENPFNTSLLLSYVFIEWIKAHSPIAPVTDGRITIIP